MSELGWTQKQFAEALNCTQQHVSVLLNGRVNMTLETLSKLEDALDFCLIGGDLSNPGISEGRLRQDNSLEIGLYGNRFTFHSADIFDWLRSICLLRNADISSGVLVLDFNSIPRYALQPDNIATLACLIEEISRKGIKIEIDVKSPAGDSLLKDYRIGEYWDLGVNYTPASDEHILNLWRIDKNEIELHSRRIAGYLAQRFFQNKDLSAVSLSLSESFFNVFDHANADGNAFCMLSLNITTGVLRVAVCDFGIGIPQSVRHYLGNDISDKNALCKAIETGFSVQSNSHNAGLGLSNIKNACSEYDTFRIISNLAEMIITGKEMQLSSMDYNFKGTLLSYELTLAKYDDAERDVIEW